MKTIKYTLLIFVTCLSSCAAGDYSTDLGDRYLFVSESNANQYIYNLDDTSGIRNVPCTVDRFQFDEKYIIAKQNPNLDCSGKGFIQGASKFYIIDKKKKVQYGPLDSLNFLKKKDSLLIKLEL